ncbi:MAG: hypothetical protein LBR17_03345 [Bacteroidales bacterium]|jgi:chromate transport protein ChrA|nr:hypothetical protein [Bacteroidales bacterium]
MKSSHFKSLMAVFIAVLLILVMQLIQSGMDLPDWKFWLCFGVVSAALIYIMYAVVHLIGLLKQARKEISNFSKQINEIKKEEIKPDKPEISEE